MASIPVETLTRKSDSTLHPDHLIEGFLPYLGHHQESLFRDIVRRDRSRFFEIVNEASRQYRRGTPEFFKIVISWMLNP